MVSKNWKLFVARLSGLWLHKILLDHPKKKIFPTKTKKIEGTNGPGPLLLVAGSRKCKLPRCMMGIRICLMR
jgi:hypothetical protein